MRDDKIPLEAAVTPKARMELAEPGAVAEQGEALPDHRVLDEIDQLPKAKAPKAKAPKAKAPKDKAKAPKVVGKYSFCISMDTRLVALVDKASGGNRSRFISETMAKRVGKKK